MTIKGHLAGVYTTRIACSDGQALIGNEEAGWISPFPEGGVGISISMELWYKQGFLLIRRGLYRIIGLTESSLSAPLSVR